MNSIFSCDRRARPTARPTIARLASLFGFVIVGASLLAVRLHAQGGSDPTAEFKRISGELSAARLGGGDENEAQMEKALAYLDSIAVSVLNGPASPDLDEGNRRLAEPASHTPLEGWNYRLVTLRGTSAKCHATYIVFKAGNGSESKRLTCHRQSQQRNKNCPKWAAPWVIQSCPLTTSIRPEFTSK